MAFYYILFDSQEQAVKLHGLLKAAGLTTVISPTPRQASICCGVSLMVQEGEMKNVSAYLKEHRCAYRSVERVEQNFNARRDQYC